MILCTASRQQIFLGIALIALMGMGFALYAQYQLNLEPCPLCIFQRVALIATGGLALLCALSAHVPVLAKSFGGLTILGSMAGAGIAGWHVRLQHLPAEQVPACGPGLDYMLETMPFSKMLGKVFHGSGECASIDWTLLGFSMPVWTLALFILLTVLAIIGFRKAR